MSDTQLVDTPVESTRLRGKTWYLTSEVAKLCNVHRNTILTAIRQGKLRAFKTPGGHARIHKDDLAAFTSERNLPVEAAENPTETDAAGETPRHRRRQTFPALTVVQNLPAPERTRLLYAVDKMKEFCVVEDGYPLIKFDIFPAFNAPRDINYLAGVIQGAAYGLKLTPDGLLHALVDFDRDQ